MQPIISALGVFSPREAPRFSQSSSLQSRPLLWTVLVSVFLFCTIARGLAQVSVQIGQNFTSSTYGNQSQAIPADANGAIGPQHFMEFINGSVTVYKKTNGVSVQHKTDLKFWSDAGVLISTDSGIADPRVIYDPSSRRWFASQVDFTSSAIDPCFDPTFYANDFLLAVSVTNDPTKGWHGFLFQSDPDNGYFADFPTLGVDSNAVYISGDFYFDGDNNPIGAGLVSIPKADLLAHTPTIDNRTWFGLMDYAERGQVLQPAICFDGSSSGQILAMGNIGSDAVPYSTVVGFAVLNAASTSGATLTASTNITVPDYMVPYNVDEGVPFFTARQPDGTDNLAGNDARLSAKVYAVGGVLYAVHSTFVDNRIAVRWYRIRASDHTLLEAGTLSDPDLDLFFPSIAANSFGTVVIGYNGSSPSHYVGCYAVVGATFNGETTFGSPLLLQAGTHEYHGDDELLLPELCDSPAISRWGDYTSTSVDPSDPSRFWTIQMYPDPTDTDIWSTQITELITYNPVLLISRSNNVALVSWPQSSLPYRLESSFTPTGGWTVVSQNLSTNSGQVFYQKPVAGSNTFFRLHQP